MGEVLTVARHDLAGLARRWWVGAIIALGLVGVVTATLRGVSESGEERADAFHSAMASVYLLGGLVLGLALGATAFWTSIRSGNLGLLVTAGASRLSIALGRVASRLIALAVGFALWTAGGLIGAASLGRGFDGPLAVHGLATYETLAYTTLVAAAASTVLGPAISAFAGLSAHILAQAVVNLEAAADLGRMGNATTAIHIGYNILARAIPSPMIVDMQNRGVGGPAAPQFEINNLPVPLQSAGIGSVLLTLAWCALMVWLIRLGTRHRTFN